MAMATTCCLNSLINPPPPLPAKSHSVSSISTHNKLVPWNNEEKKGSWHKRCVLGVAGAAIALQMAGECGGSEMGINYKNVNFVDSRKWSEERMCPQWRFNSLETVVPENLPRPAGRRRWEPAALPRSAPQLRITHITSPSSRCFSISLGIFQLREFEEKLLDSLVAQK